MNILHSRFSNTLLVCGLCCYLPAWASDSTRLSTLVVHGQSPQSAALSTSRIDLADLPHPNPRSLNDGLSAVPGVFALNQDNAAQGLRVSIRGFGSRAAFGVRGIQVNLDGVPLSMPDGQTDLDAIDPGLLASISVIRGPSASLYGNGAGGLLSLNTRKAENTDFRIAVDALPEAGRQGRVEASLPFAHGFIRGALAQAHYDGPRDHSHVDYRWQHLGWSKQSPLGLWSLNYYGLDADALDPGGLTREQVSLDRGAARQRNVDFYAGERIDQQRLSLSWEHNQHQWLHTAQTWYGRRRFDNRLPFESAGQVQFDRHFAGVGLLSQHDGSWAGRPRRLSFGIDVQQQEDQRQRFDNLIGGQRGSLQLEQDEQAQSWASYGQLAWQLTPAWQWDASLRYEQLKFRTDDRFLSDGNDSGQRRFKLSAFALGLQYRKQQHRLFSRYANSYETPTINELANPNGGGFNRELDANRSNSLELGWSWQNKQHAWQWVTFAIQSQDELQAFELENQPGRRFYHNRGKTQRFGSELAMRWQLSPFWALDLNASYLRARFDNGGQDNNALPGLPELWLQSGAQFSYSNWRSRLQARAVDDMYTDDANTQSAPGYWRIDWLNQWQATQWGWPGLQLKFAVDNLLNAKYSDNIRINAFGQRSFEPAAGTRIRLGLAWKLAE